jgi:hypothetical protein
VRTTGRITCIGSKGAAYTRLVNVEDDLGLLLLRHVHDSLEHSNAVIPAQNISLRRWIGSSGYVSPLPTVPYLPLLNPVPHRSMSGTLVTPLQKVDNYSRTAVEFVGFLLHSIHDESLIQYYSQNQLDAMELGLRSTLESINAAVGSFTISRIPSSFRIHRQYMLYRNGFQIRSRLSHHPPVFSIYQEGKIIDSSR